MQNFKITTLLCISVLAFFSCQSKPKTDDFLTGEIENIEAQHTLQTDIIEKHGSFINPRTIKDGKIVYVPIDDILQNRRLVQRFLPRNYVA